MILNSNGQPLRNNNKAKSPIIKNTGGELFNGLGDIAELMMYGANGQAAAPSNNFDQIFFNNRYTLLSNNRQMLSALYMTNGLTQKFIDLAVDDAFRGGISIKSSSLGEKNIKKLLQYIDENDIINIIGMAKKWARLYGGSGLIINCDQDPSKPFNINLINKNSNLDFIPADLWELAKHDENKPDLWMTDTTEVPYNYYGKALHKTRVLKIKGKEPTSWDRPRLRNWGMSELERILSELNNHMRAIDLIFELLGQYKIDVWKIQGYNDELLSQSGNVEARMHVANKTKNYLNAIIMDKEDDFIQKQCHFSGLAEILNEIRKGICCVLSIPMTKLFGISAAGFSSGEDDLENYNTMIEHEIRAKVKYIIIDVLQIISKKLFDTIPDDLEITFPSLRILSGEQEEHMKSAKLQRVLTAFNSGLMDSKEAILSINHNDLVGVELKEKNIQSITKDNNIKLEDSHTTSKLMEQKNQQNRLKDETYFRRYKHNRGTKS